VRITQQSALGAEAQAAARLLTGKYEPRKDVSETLRVGRLGIGDDPSVKIRYSGRVIGEDQSN
jgi:hypothetical protein